MTLELSPRSRTILKRLCIVGLAFVAAAGCRSRISTAEQDAIDRAEVGKRAVGWRQVKSINEVSSELGCGGRRAVVARFDEGQVIPVRPSPGSEINHRIVYSACPGAADKVTGTLTRRIYFGRATIMEEKEQIVLRPGRWSIDVFMKIPPQAGLGWYRMEAVFENPSAYARDRRDFQVVATPGR